jgi:predicted secreted protein
MKLIQLNVFYKILLMLFAAAFVLISCRQLPAEMQKMQTISFTGKDSGKNLELLAGQRFLLTLPDKVDGGYRFNRIKMDTTILRIEKYIEHLPVFGETLGKPGQTTW